MLFVNLFLRLLGRHLLRSGASVTLLLVFGLTSLVFNPDLSVALAAPAEQMLTGTNGVRADAGLGPLTRAETLDALATDRSTDMVTRHYFGHITPEGVNVFALMAQRGIGYTTAGENLAWNTALDDQASAFALRGFMNSPSHRANMLNPSFRQLGIGVARDGGTIYLTLVFVG